MTTSTSHLQRPEGSIGYDLTGSGPLVICVPGMGELRSSFRATVPALVAAGFRVATMDLRGHGDSDTTFTGYDDLAAAEDVLALAEHLGAGPDDRALLIGNSMGGSAVVSAAGDRPDIVAGVVVLDGFVRNQQMNAVLTLVSRLLVAGPWTPWAWGKYLTSLYPARKPTDFAEHLSEVTTSLRRPGYRRAFARTVGSLDHDVVTPSVPRIVAAGTPVLVVVGEKDADYRDAPAEGAWMAEQLHAELLVVDGAGHYPQVEFPEIVNPALTAFAGKAFGRA